MAFEHKLTHLNVALLASDFLEVCNDLKSKPSVKYYPLGHDLEGSVFIESLPVTMPLWLDAVQESIAEQDPLCFSHRVDLPSIPKSAIILIKEEDRAFALTFGNGYRLLKKHFLDPTFGLRVTLNAVDPQKLKKIGKRTIGSPNPISTRISALSLSPISLPTEYNETIYKIQDQRYRGHGPYVSTRYVLQSWDQIPDLLSNLYMLSGQENYKDTFPFIQFIEPLGDANIKKRLHQKMLLEIDDWTIDPLVASVNDHSLVSFKINVDTYSNEKFSEFSSIAKEKIQTIMSNNIIKKKIDRIKKEEVIYLFVDGNENSVRLYNHILYDTVLDNKFYALQGGYWYHIKKTYADEVDDYGQQILNRTLISNLPSSHSKEEEADYNRRVIKSSEGRFLLMDRRDVWADRQDKRSTIEMCDIIDTQNKSLIHVKDSTDSALLSHLFAQGSTAALTLKNGTDYRQNLKKKFIQEELIDLLKEKFTPLFLQIREHIIEVFFETDTPLKEKLIPVLSQHYQSVFQKKLKIKSTDIAIEEKRKLKKNISLSLVDFFIQFFEEGFWESIRGKIRNTLDGSNSGVILDPLLSIIEKTVGAPCNEDVKHRIVEIFGHAVSRFDRMIIEPYDPRQYQILYGIILRKKENRPLPIPFFSRIQLKYHGENIQRMGYNVGLEFIQPANNDVILKSYDRSSSSSST